MTSTYSLAWDINEAHFTKAKTPAEKLQFLLQYAVLAPSIYNSQPWRFHVEGHNVDLYLDRDRTLPVVDPQNRLATISCGAALFYLRIAMRHFGHEPIIQAFPDGPGNGRLAQVKLGHLWPRTPGTELLFRSMPRRHTNRRPFESEPLPERLLLELDEASTEEGAWLQTIDGPIRRNGLSDLVDEADRVLWSNAEFRADLARWINPEPQRTNDGLIANGVLQAFLVRTFDLGHGQALADRQWVEEAPALAVLGTKQDDPQAWLAAGQALAHMLLRAAAEGVAASFLSSPVLVREMRDKLGELVGRIGFPQVVLRLGYGQEVLQTPRRPVSEVLEK